MENSFSSKEKGVAYWGSPRAQMESVSPLDAGPRNSPSDDPFNNISELMNFDAYAGWCNSPTDHMFASCGSPSFHSTSYASLEALNLPDRNPATAPDSSDLPNATETSCNYGDDMLFQQTSSLLGCADLYGAGCLPVARSTEAHQQNNISDMANLMVPQPIGMSLDEKMLSALSLLKESSGGGILAQVWVPIKHGDQYMLSTAEQPYLLDQMLAGYREVSRTFTFSAEGKPGLPQGLPGRVFSSKVPEWTSNVIYYSKAEYLRAKHAVEHEVQGSFALPVFYPHEMSCCAVLELVTIKEKPDFDLEMENVCKALEAVNLRSAGPSRIPPQCLSRNQRAALAEISDVLRAVCHAHRLPLALTWIPCYHTKGAGAEMIKVHFKGANSKSTGKCVLCIESTACYVNDAEMQGFVHACALHYIEEGQGTAGKALQSNHPFFLPDVKACDISEYPLVHHARKYGLNAVVSIRLRSTHTGDDDYILEFFLPVSIKGSAEQQLLLNNLSGTMQRICKSLRTVSDRELVGGDASEARFQNGEAPSLPAMVTSRRCWQTASSEGQPNSSGKTSFGMSSSKSGAESDSLTQQKVNGSRRQTENKRSITEKNVSLSVLQQYFSGSLKDAAKSIGVCPTTLKRICRQHGISRWPSRKINKVNRSLRKIQTVLDSVQGVEGGLKFDPTTGSFVAKGSAIQETDPQNCPLFPDRKPSGRNAELISQEVGVAPSPCINGDNSTGKVEGGECYVSSGLKKSTINGKDCSENSKSVAMDIAFRQQASPGSGLWGGLENASMDPYFMSQSSGSLPVADEMDIKMEGDGIEEHNQPASSSMTDSSNGTGSGSLMHGSSSSSPSCEEKKHSKFQTSSSDGGGSMITVKAIYKKDTIRFKFYPAAGCLQLYEEVSKRFKLQNGTFQLKYLDDEEEWVLLLNDSDLQECVETLDSLGTRSVKFQVRDTPFAMGSGSGSNSCMLGGGA